MLRRPKSKLIAGAIAVGKVEKTTEAGKQTAEVDTGKKVSEHDHTVGKVVAGTVVTGGVIAIGAATHVKNTISSWLAKLKTDVADCVEQGGDQKQVEAIVAKANADIEIQLQETYKKTETTDVSKTVKEQLIASTELAKKTALKSSAQVQAVTVEVVSSGKATGASVKERINTIIKSSEQEVHTELEKIDSGLVIEVEHKDSEVQVTKPVHKIEEVKTEVIKEEAHVHKDSKDETIVKKPVEEHHEKEHHHSKIGIIAGIGGAVAAGAAGVAIAAHHHHDKKEEDKHQSEEVVHKNTGVVAEHKHNEVEKTKIEADVEKTKIDSDKKTDIEKVTTGAGAIAVGKIEKTTEAGKQTAEVDTGKKVSEHDHTVGKVVAGTVVTGGVIAIGAATHVKNTISSWLAKLKTDVADCVEQGGDQKQVEAIVAKANADIEIQLQETYKKTETTDVSKTVKEQLIASTELAKKTALKSSAQVQAVTVEVVSSGKATGASVKERIDTIIKSSEQEVHTELEKVDSGLVIEVEHKEAEVQVTKPVHKIEETKTEVIKEEVHVKPADDHHVGKIVAVFCQLLAHQAQG
ncbi:hypothetical protein LRAMOSA11510 [Lichtheimia ramosa]|uniref:Uncharacterized protein n=1 Tax=Lichtheimia ramosa TaxID=688394 RepID=A0A077X1D2_9FUNG|nr:hypothetical protein LRAMOSA11510 [Lichtheimia ramosa]